MGFLSPKARFVNTPNNRRRIGTLADAEEQASVKEERGKKESHPRSYVRLRALPQPHFDAILRLTSNVISPSLDTPRLPIRDWLRILEGHHSVASSRYAFYVSASYVDPLTPAPQLSPPLSTRSGHLSAIVNEPKTMNTSSLISHLASLESWPKAG